MGVGTRTKAWRFTDINKDYSVSDLQIVEVFLKPSLDILNIPSEISGSYKDHRHYPIICSEVP